MKILHFCPRYAPSTGGCENYMRTISERLAHAGNAVTVAATTAIDHDALYSDRLSHAAAGQETIGGVDVRRFHPDFPSEESVFQMPSFDCTGMARFVDSLEPGDYDIVNAACLPFENLLLEAGRAAEKLKCPLVLTPLLHTHPRLSEVYQSPRLKAAMQPADRVVTQTAHEAGFLTRQWEMPSEKVVVVGVGIDLDAGLSGGCPDTKEEENEAAPTVMFLGTHDRLKGTISLLDASRRFGKEEVRFLFAGQTTVAFREYLDANRNDWPSNATLLGRIDERTKRDLLRRMTCLALPSAAESFGQVYLEAWLHRKPVIGARHGAIECIIDDNRTGKLVEFEDVDQLEAAIRGYLDNPGQCREHGEAGYETAKAYDWNKLIPRLKLIYEEAVSRC